MRPAKQQTPITNLKRRRTSHTARQYARRNLTRQRRESLINGRERDWKSRRAAALLVVGYAAIRSDQIGAGQGEQSGVGVTGCEAQFVIRAFVLDCCEAAVVAGLEVE